jgi:hypothetical protein
MPKKEYLVKLTDEERTTLLTLTKKGTIAARKLARAHILRLADEGKPDTDIVVALGVGLSTVERTRKKYVEGGLEVALNERPRPGVKLNLTCIVLAPALDKLGRLTLSVCSFFVCLLPSLPAIILSHKHFSPLHPSL